MVYSSNQLRLGWTARPGASPRVPAWLGRLATGEVGVSMMTRIRGSSNEKAKRELGWQPGHPTWREGLGLDGVEPSRRS
jgi:hypothetical protein